MTAGRSDGAPLVQKTIVANGPRPGVEPERLLEHWQSAHATLVRTHLAPSPYGLTTLGPAAAPYCGIATLSFAGGRPGGGEIPPEIRADPFYDMIGARVLLDTVEHVVLDGPRQPHGVKLTVFVRRRAGVGAEDFFGHWLEVHAPSVAAALGLVDGGMRYVVNVARGAPDGAPYHGAAELWYRDSAAARAHADTLVDDGFGRYADSAHTLTLAGREQLLTP